MLLDHNTFFVRERVAFVKLTDTYDILDPRTGQQIGLAREEPTIWAKWLRLLLNKAMMPTVVRVYETDGGPALFSIHRGVSIPFVRTKIRVAGPDGEPFGHFRRKVLSLAQVFYVLDNADQQIAEVKGDWKGWNFKFLTSDGNEIGTVTKKWAGLGRELFTSADNYIIVLAPDSAGNHAATILLLAAGLAIDTVLKDNQG